MKAKMIGYLSAIFILSVVFVPINAFSQEEPAPGEGTQAAQLDQVDKDRPELSADVAFLSQYIWRGYAYTKDSLVVQPSVTAGYKGFALNLWGNLDTNYAEAPYESNTKWNETDMTFSYGRSFGMVGVEAGFIYYALDGAYDSKEFYLSGGVDTLLAPTLTVYREVSKLQGWYIALGLSHSFELPHDISLDLAGTFSYYKSDNDDMVKYNHDLTPTDERFSGLHDGLVSVGLTIPFWKYFTVTPAVAYAFPLSHQADNELQAVSMDGDADHIIGGVTLSMAF